MKELNVCLLNDSFPPLIDGVGNAVVNYAENIKKCGGRATVVTPSYPDVSDEAFPFPVVRYPSVDFSKFCGYRAGYPFDAKVLDRLNKENFDIIHSHCPIASTMLARALREITEKPLIFTYHTKFDIDIKNTIRSEKLQRLAIKVLVNNIEACDEVWVVSNGAGENLRTLGYTGDYRVMENGVDFARGRANDAQIAAINAAHGIGEDEVVLLFVGRMMWYKGIRILLDAARLLLNEGLRFRLMFVGEGGDFEEIKAYAETLRLGDACIFAGAQRDRERLRAYFCRATMFVFPSTFDTNGIVVREAAACGLASMLIAGSCAAEGITDGRNGIFCEENAESAARAMRFACKNPQVLREIGMHAMREIYISWETAVRAAYARYGEIDALHRAGAFKDSRRVPLDSVYGTLAELIKEFNRWRSLPARKKDKTDEQKEETSDA